MKKRLRLLAWLITLTILCQMLPFSAFAQSDIAQTLVQRRVSASSLDEQNDLSSVTFEGGTGTPEDPYQIATAEQLDAIRNNLGASYVLVNDIDLSNYGNWVPIGDSSSSGFTGTLDGNGHSIQNMTITSSGLDYSAFIGSALNATVKNLSLENVDIEVSDTHCVAGIIGSAVDNCIIESCSVSGNIRVTTARVELLIGGIAGNIVRTSSSSDPQISNSVNRAAITVDGPDFTILLSCGGIAGYSNATISSCDNYGEIHSISDNSIFAGGIVGDCSASVISCKNFGTVYGQSNKETYTVAGIAGRASVSYCVNSGSVHGHSQSGFSYGGNATGINGLNSSSARFCYNIAANIDSTYGDDSSLSVAYRIGCGSTRYNCYSLDSTLVNGAVTTEYASTAMVNGESLSYDEILSRIKEIFPDFELEPAPDIPDLPEKEFSFNKDNLSFLNGGSYFFNDWELYYSQYYNGLTHKVLDYIDRKYADGEGNQYFYQISNEKFNQLIGKGTSYQFKPRVIKFLNNHRFISWGGSCEGMSRIVMLHYLRPDLLPLDLITVTPNSTVYDLNAPKDDNSVENLTNYYFLMQYFPTAENYLAHTVTNYRANPSGSVEEIYQDLRKGNPVFASISGNGGGHAIVLLDIISETSDYYDISVSDPNCPFALSLKLFKNTDGDFPKIEYCNTYTYNGKKVDGYTYDRLQMHILSEDINILDLRNYFGYSNNESQTDYDDAHVILNERLTDMDYYYGEVFVRNKDGVLEYSDNVLEVPNTSSTLDDLPSRTEFIFPSQPGEVFKMTLTPDGDNSVTSDILLDDTLFSISASGAVELTYDEQNRTVDVKSTTNKPIQVNMSFTQNDTSDAWPWNSWAIDTTDTTTFHAELKDDGLHLSGDGIANAKYATEYMGSDGEDDVISKGTIPAGADNVTIVNKNGSNGNTTDIKTPDPVEPAELTVSVSGGTIIQINDDAFAESLTTHTAKQGDKITIMADTTDKFNGWTVNEGDFTLDDATAPTTTFTMGEKSVEITAEYKDDSTEPVEPAELTVSVSGGTIIQINDDAFAESLTTHTAKQGDKITIMADTTDKFNGWIVNEGDVTLDDATAPTTTFTMNEKSVHITAEYQNSSTDPTPTPTPGGNSSSGSGGGGGGGAAVLIGVGAAAAITAGVFMMSPVEIKGRVVLADQAAVPGAKISLLREGKVVAQTTADENGNFSLKAKRGSYELTAAYTNADGQLIYKTINIKAPAKDLTMTF